MPRAKLPRRTLREIYALGREIGDEYVLLNDAELGVVLTGSDEAPISSAAVANKRWSGELTTPVVRTTAKPRTRLSDAKAEIQKSTREIA